MPYPSISGLCHEQPVLTAAVTPLLPQLEKRGITQQTLSDYASQTQAMKESSAGKGGKVSDQKQFTKSEKDAVHTLRKELRNVHGGFKRTFPQGSPQWKEVHIGEKDNNSTARLLIYSADTAKAWEKYKSVLTAKGRLVQADVDAMTAAAAVLQSTDTTQETAKSVDTRDATAKKNQAKQIVLTTADSIYNAIEREFHNDTATLAKFAAIKELRFTPDVAEEEEPAPKPTTANQTADTSKSTSVVK